MLAQEVTYQVNSGVPAVVWAIYALVYLVLIIAWWRVFTKAGHPGWAAIIPFYNIYIMCKVAGRPGWWLILFLIPIVNIVILFIVAIDIAKNFGKGTGFGIGVALLSFIFVPILGFGDAVYRPVTPGSVPAAPQAPPVPPPPPA
jgi:hypothetical protein